jgi:hypothetical protein
MTCMQQKFWDSPEKSITNIESWIVIYELLYTMDLQVDEFAS